MIFVWNCLVDRFWETSPVSNIFTFTVHTHILSNSSVSVQNIWSEIFCVDFVHVLIIVWSISILCCIFTRFWWQCEVFPFCTVYLPGFGDNVKCFYCDGGLRNWEPGDDPWSEHARWFPRCSFVRTVKGDQFIQSTQERFSHLNSTPGKIIQNVYLVECSYMTLYD